MRESYAYKPIKAIDMLKQIFPIASGMIIRVYEYPAILSEAIIKSFENGDKAPYKNNIITKRRGYLSTRNTIDSKKCAILGGNELLTLLLIQNIVLSPIMTPAAVQMPKKNGLMPPAAKLISTK